MKAAVLRNFRANLSIEDIPDPRCPKDGVVLEVMACGVCRSDFHGWSGEHPKVKIGDVLGHEYCGTVVEAGRDAHYKVGDRLIAPFILGCGKCISCQKGASNTCDSQLTPGFGMPGAYAEYIAVPFDHNLVVLPDSIKPTLASGLGCRVTTAWHALTDRANVRAGEWVAVHGTGGIGLSVLLLAKMLGARVAVVDVVQEKLDLAKSLGADICINAAEQNVVEFIMDQTSGGAHVSIEALGIAQTTNASVECLRTSGRHVQIGMPAGDGMMNINLRAVYAKQLSFFGSRGMPSWKYPSLLEMIDQGKVNLDPLVSREVSLSAASAELKLMEVGAPPGTAVITEFKL